MILDYIQQRFGVDGYQFDSRWAWIATKITKLLHWRDKLQYSHFAYECPNCFPNWSLRTDEPILYLPLNDLTRSFYDWYSGIRVHEWTALCMCKRFHLYLCDDADA